MFHGSIVALVTPMSDDGSVDYTALDALIEWQIESGTNGILVLGTTGESPTITSEERQQIIRSCVDTVAGRVPVIAGTGSNSTQITIQYSQEAMDLGVDACLVVTPYYNKPTQEGLYRHYKAIAEAVGLPIILYNNPTRTGCDLLPETVERLSHFANIVGLKEASPDSERPQQLISALSGVSMDILSGDDINTLAYIKAGAKGVISTTANVAPQLVSQMCEAALSGDFESAHAIDQQLNPLYAQLFIETNPIPTKWALSAMGKMPGGIRLPLTELSESKHNGVRSALVAVGLL